VFFAGVNEVGFLFHFAPLNEAQNSGKMEQSVAFYPSGVANSDRLNESFGTHSNSLCRDQPE
jgi:hypothetical protein